MNTFEFAKEFLADKQYLILDENVEDGHIAFRYQMNTIHLWTHNDDENFCMIVLSGFAEANHDNIGEVEKKCYQVTKDVKLVKLYLLHNLVLATAELYYYAQEDFNFQIENALKHIVKAKVMYKQLDE